MDKNISVRHQQKTDTALNWKSQNPILLLGEFGIESDTDKIKIGDGISAWNTLPYYTVTLDDIKDAIKKYDAAKHLTLQEYLQDYM